MKKNIRGIHILLGGSSVNGHSAEDLARIAVEGGASVVQLREKHLPMDVLLPIAKRIRTICRDITFIVNDRADLALILEADGVHLGQDDLPIKYARELLTEKSIIGISCGSLEEALSAQKGGADYIGFGHLFPTSSKIKPAPPRSLEELKEVCSVISIPVIAIGGITLNNQKSVLDCGAAGLAIISAFTEAEDPREGIQKFVKNFTARQ
jgi:thiamine-phosphate pyrophosphorylase